MDKFINDLVSLAYTYYPKGMLPEEVGYQESLEAVKLSKALLKKEDYKVALTTISEEIASNDSQVCYENLTIVNYKTDRSVKAKFFYPDKQERALLLYISVIEPLYVIYESEQAYSFNDFTYVANAMFVKPDVSSGYKILFNLIEQILHKHLPEYVRMEYHVFRTELTNVTYGNYGDVYPSNILKKMTLFNAFFADNYF